MNATNQRYREEREELLRKVCGMEEQLKAILTELDPAFLLQQEQPTQMEMTATAGVLGASLPVSCPEDGSCEGPAALH